MVITLIETNITHDVFRVVNDSDLEPYLIRFKAGDYSEAEVTDIIKTSY